MQMRRSFFAIIASVFIAAVPLAASAQVSVGVGVGFGGPGWGVGVAAYSPPPLPVYSQPPAPYPGWQWIPGYWGWGAYGYYWIPGYWTAPPAVGLYWTPGYWGYSNGYYGWYPGYWGPTVGFYGGINYGFGYFGTGFAGGFWSGGIFNYNTAVVNVNRTVIRNTFNRTIIRGRAVAGSRVSFNGGRRGIRARPTRAQLAARRHGLAETRAQRIHERIAARDRGQLAAVNHGHPRVAAVQRPFSATHRPANMHAITAADRRVAQRTMTRHTISAATHHHASAQHRNVAAAMHHSAFARHGTVSAAVHHSAPVRHSAFSAPMRHGSVSARSVSHATFSGRSGGGFPHAAGGRMGGGGGGRMGGGGGGRGRPPRG
jgi:hypothetical protein